MNKPDIETIIQILIFVVIFGAGIIQFIYRTFVKPIQEAERRRRAEGGADPEKTIRDFLAELRGERPERGEPDLADAHGEDAREDEARGAAAGREEAPPRRDLIWEVVQEAPPPQPPRPVVPPVVREVVRDKRAADRRGARAARRRAAARHEERPREASGGMAGSLEERSEGERRATAHVAKTFSQSLGGMASGSERIGIGDAGGILGPLGTGLREAILAQVILGPPRAFHSRGGSGLAGGRHGGRVRP